MNAHVYNEQGILYIEGELNFITVVKIWKDSLPLIAQQQALRIDLSKVTSANSAAITLLLEWLKYASQLKKTITFSNTPEQILSLATISGTNGLLNL